MLNSVLLGALGGGLGAALGSLLVYAWGKVKADAGGRPKTVGNMVVLGLGLVGARLASALGEPSLESQLDANPTLAALHEHFPAEFQELVEAVRAEGLSDATAFQAKAMPIVSRVVSAHTARLDDRHARDMALLAIDEAKLLRDKDPGSCIAFFEGKPLAVALNSVLPDEMKARDQAVTAAILTQVATAPAKPPTDLSSDDTLALALAAIERLPADERAVAGPLITEGKSPVSAVELRTKCDFTIGMLQSAVEGPPERLRAMLGTR